MPKLIATIFFVAVIIGLFVLDRDRQARTSKALWIPFVYLLIIGSRPVSFWLGGDTPAPDAIYGNGIYSSPLDAIVSFILLALGLMTLVARWRQVGSLLKGRSVPIILFYAYAGLSILWSDFPYSTLKHWTKAIEDVVMALVIWTEVDPVMAVRRLLTRAGFILIPLSLLFSKYYPDLGRGFSKDWTTVYNGVTETKNELGVICLIFGLTSLWCFLGALGERKGPTRRRRLAAHSVMMVAVVTMLLMSHSMTATVNLVLCGAVMVAVNRSSPAKPARAHLAVAAALCIAMIPIFIAPSLVESLGRDTTFSGRTVIWHILPTFVRNPWLGAGYETFLMGPRLVQLKAIIDKTFQEAHNGYIEVWLNLGWIGVSLFAFLVVSGYRTALAAVRRDSAIGSLRLAFFAAALIEGLTEAAYRMMSPVCFLLLWSIVDNSMAVRKNLRRERQRNSLGDRTQSEYMDVSETHASASMRPDFSIPS